MSRKKSTHVSMSGQNSASHAKIISAQELEDRWNSLHLHPETKDHLEHILQEQGLELALAATTAIVLELKREEHNVTQSLWGWVIEELRLLFLEEGCQHLIESSRLIIDALLTWTLVQGPVFFAHLIFPLLAFGLLPIFLCLVRFLRQHRASGQK